MITLSPEREAIFSHLAQIGYKRFPEFVLDILVFVEGHKPIDITDGTGDEKQDILTETPSGERQLTQCKHTIDYKEHASGDELDLLFGACCRKNCTKGLYVTNSDLTPQGKRYVNDKEYMRGWRGPKELLPDIDYWNSTHIWDRISTHNDILNKWFSGMGQAHGLRHFSFDLVIQRQPAGESPSLRCVDVVKTFKDRAQVHASESNQTFTVTLNENVTFTIADWFCSDLDLGVRYVAAESDHRFVNIPLWALRVQLTISKETGQYDPRTYRDLVVKFIADTALPRLKENEWWYLVATPAQAFIFLQDIVEPKTISISPAECYVKNADAPVAVEKYWVFPQGADYERIPDDGETLLRWRHLPSAVTVTLMLNQRTHPITAYEHYILQQHMVESLRDYELRQIKKASQEIVERVRRISSNEWVLMLSNSNDLYVAFSAPDDRAQVAKIDESFRRLDIPFRSIVGKEKEKTIKKIKISTKESVWSLVADESSLVEPIWLNKRLFLLSKDLKLETPLTKEMLPSLINIKANYEAKHGFNLGGERDKLKITSEEVWGVLFDLLTIRGNRMLDVAPCEGGLSINLRFRETSAQSAMNLLPGYLSEMNELAKEISTKLISINS